MVCDLPEDAAWPALLQARELLARRIGELAFVRAGEAWQCLDAAAAQPPADREVLLVADPRSATPRAERATPGGRCTLYTPRADGTPAFEHPHDQPVDSGFLAVARVYLPVLLGAALARHRGSVFVVAHVTQSLDGRIACLNGQSQWIGNDNDLLHAHRMRALLEGVLVGAGTVLADDPRLTVRHVDGPSPRRFVLSGCGRVLRHDRPLHVFAAPGCDVIVGGSGHRAPAGPVRLLPVAAQASSALDPLAIRAALHAAGVASVYLEGGAATLSSFVRAGAVDLLQVHIAPLILGSGVPSFSLPPIAHVRDGLPFAMDHAMLGGHVLLSCWPRRTPVA